MLICNISPILSIKPNYSLINMKKILPALVALLLLCPFVLWAQTGKVWDNLSLPSKILKSDRKYAVYLPPGYETSERSYPVLYLLHGGGDDQTGWVQFGEVLNITDKAIAEGIATPMIIIMPDANTGRRGYFNDVKGDWNYEDFFFKELVPFVEKKYRIKDEKRFRAVAGLSMGGGGSFVYALHHPEMFSSACPLSAATGPLTIEDARKMLTRDNPNIADSVVTQYYNRQSVVALVNAVPDDQKKAVRWLLMMAMTTFCTKATAWCILRCVKKTSHMSSAFAMAATPGPTGVHHYLMCWSLYHRPFISTDGGVDGS
jgi:pimeloyl-ACP methyl ester carboxylesterase